MAGTTTDRKAEYLFKVLIIGEPGTGNLPIRIWTTLLQQAHVTLKRKNQLQKEIFILIIIIWTGGFFSGTKGTSLSNQTASIDGDSLCGSSGTF